MSESEDNLMRDNGPPAAGAIRALVADDDPAIRLVLRHRLEAERWQVEEAADSGAALQALRSGRFDVALVDIMMPGAGGLEVLTTAREEGCASAIVVITAASTMNNAIEALKRGAHDYLTKPFENLDLVVTTAARAAEAAVQLAQLDEIKGEVAREQVRGEIIGRSPAMQEVYKLIGRVVSNDAIVLLNGESGTGKELVARAIHFKSARWRAPFVAVNSSAIPHGLVESELFGHERGAFTGAHARREGAFAEADGGTLFLDEIGDLPIEAQPKLLRALDGYEVRRVGGAGGGRRSDVRVVAATHVRLEQRVTRGDFRRDLFHRLECLVVSVPPLRERRGDIGAISRELLRQLAAEVGPRTLTAAAVARLTAHDWPGNVRELRNVLCRAADASPAGARIDIEDIDRAMRRDAPALARCVTRERARELFRESSGNLSAAARAAGMPRTSFRKLLRA